MIERRGRRADRGVVLLALIAVVVLATATYAWVALRVDRITDSLRRREPLNVLFLLSDGGDLVAVEAFLYNPATRKASLYHVPPNLGGVIPSLNRVDGIDALGPTRAALSALEECLDLDAKLDRHRRRRPRPDRGPARRSRAVRPHPRRRAVE
jgi:hypothetical protein